ncbi:hypothetical protein [Acidisoma cladoniae]|uniref:hypothetical protein n=1 Tax=Acidisoma cladoniae TaxID=3040935 RepID=UPI00254E96DF|nr:hypothetical protein [Acidisoma sp. PAMC 29798]
MMRLRDAVDAVQQRAQANAALQANCVSRRDAEVSTYEALFKTLDDWMQPYVAEEKIQSRRIQMIVIDPELGELTVPALSIRPVPTAGIEVTVTPTGTTCANIRNEIKLKRADGLSRTDDYFIYKLVSDGASARWFIARRSRNAGKPKLLLPETFEEAVCALILA